MDGLYNLYIEKDIKLFFNILKKRGLIKQIIPSTSLFHDEPKIIQYNGFFKDQSRGAPLITGTGVSFESKQQALIRCLGEGIERICLSSYKEDDVVYKTRCEISHPLCLDSYKKDTHINDKKMGWVKGWDVFKNSPIYIPAQLIYLNYLANNKKEYTLDSSISTGAAAGRKLEETLLKGIYEIVERDAFMTIYLNQIPVSEIDISKIRSVRKLQEYLNRYKLEWRVFDFTHDLAIPVVVSILIDKSGNGPSISFGMKCGFDISKNIIESAEEATMVRQSVRKMIQGGSGEAYLNSFTAFERLIYSRAVYWWPSDAPNRLGFLLKNPKKNLFKKSRLFASHKEELALVLQLLRSKNQPIYYKDITSDLIDNHTVTVLKTIIPTLQPLYLKEKGKRLMKKRLKEVSLFFKKSTPTFNTIPHPFL
jgi:ribosomal protein S12 methylthiotransferase accessory factor